MSKVQELISAAKIRLGISHPFIGTLLYGLNMVEDNAYPYLAATDGKRIIYNPGKIEELNVQQTMFLLAHECMHVAFMHTLRLHERDRFAWNVATDILINEMLINDKVGEFIEGGVRDTKLYHKGDENADNIYALLPIKPQDKQAGGNSGDDGGGDGDDQQPNGGYGNGNPFDELMKPNGGRPMTDSEMAEMEADIKMRVAQAAQAAKMAGKLSAGQARIAEILLEVKVDWRRVLQQFMVRCKDEARSWSRPNRRFVSQGLYCPSVDGESMGDIVVAIDTSGSIGPDELNQFATEVNAISQDLMPANVHVVYFDSEVCHYDCFPRHEDVVIRPHGGGGTAFSPVFRFLDEKDIVPDCCVFLTDLYCDDFGKAPDYPVLWVTTVKNPAPFGEVVEMKL